MKRNRSYQSVGCKVAHYLCSRYRFRILITFLFAALIPGIHGCASRSDTAVTAFSTGGHTVYHLKPATVSKAGRRAIISAAYDGSVLCHTQMGKLLWKVKPGEGFPFDLAVADIDDDGMDESLVASSDGSLHSIDHDGKNIWTFKGNTPLYRVSVAKSHSDTLVILTGGVERILYALSASGKIISKYEADGVIRLTGSGNIMGEGQDFTAVATARSGLSGNYTLRLHRLPGL